jgi:anaphase-promoting complex subunit 2
MELRQALEVTQLHHKLAVELRQTLKKRLLHPGATTGQIIDIYISTIKVLRVLDSSSDGVLDAVAGPLRDYLRERKDTVRRIVTSLTDEDADLYEELQVLNVKNTLFLKSKFILT